jgi:hypothetical protein
MSWCKRESARSFDNRKEISPTGLRDFVKLKTKTYHSMSKRTGDFIIGIGIASILAGIYAAVRSGEFLDSISGVFIGVALVGTILIDRNKKDQPE